MATTGSDKTATCEKCGSFEVLEIGGQKLCEECVTLAGCSCAAEAREG